MLPHTPTLVQEYRPRVLPTEELQGAQQRRRVSVNLPVNLPVTLPVDFTVDFTLNLTQNWG